MAKSVVTLPNLKKSGIVGIQEMRDNIGKVLNRVSATALKDVFYNAGMVLYRELDRVIPGPSKGNKDFPAGTLRKGLFITRGKPDKANVLVGIGGKKRANYLGLWLEHGTSKMAPRPFFRPSVLRSKSEMAQIIAGGIKDTLDASQ